MITNNFSLQWSQIPHFLSFHFISCKTNMKKIITLFPHHWPSFSVMYVLIHQHQEDSKWGGQELECCNKSPPGSYNCFQLLNVLEVLFFSARSKIVVCLLFPPLYGNLQKILYYSKLWNFTLIKIWMRDMRTCTANGHLIKFIC